MRSKSPVNAFNIGEKMKGFRIKVWDTKRYDVIRSLIRMNLTQNGGMHKHLLKTCVLADGGQNHFFAIELSLVSCQ